MMYQTGPFPYSRIEYLKSLAVEIPYGETDKMSMVVILPNKGESLIDLLRMMTKTAFGRVLDDLDSAKEEFEDEDVKLYVPRFSVTSDLTLNLVLDKMGIKDVFNQDAANLLGIFPHYLYVSMLVQRAEIEVSEEGTVASAAAGATVANKSPPPKFIANRPFLYFIVNKPTRCIVFAGKVSRLP